MSDYMSPEDAVGRGVALAQQLIHAAADGDDDRVVLLLNTAHPGATANAAGYLLSCLRQLGVELVEGHEDKATALLHARANAAISDVAENVAVVIINEALRRSHG